MGSRARSIDETVVGHTDLPELTQQYLAQPILNLEATDAPARMV
jgi:hypothetical protein